MWRGVSDAPAAARTQRGTVMNLRTAYCAKIGIEDMRFAVSIDHSYSLCSHGTQVHNHAMHELHFVRQGLYTYIIADRSVAIGAGQLCWIPPCTYHAKQAAHTNSGGYSIKFTCEAKPGTAPALAHTIGAMGTYRLYPAPEALFGCLDGIHAAYTHDGWGKRERIDALLVLLLTDVAGLLTRQAVTRNPSISPQADDITYAIDEFFCTHYMGQPTTADLAKSLFVSERHVNRLLQREYGLSFKSKLAEMRVNAAKDYLRLPGLSVAQVAGTVGYSSVQHFGKAFKAFTGQTPRQYRMANSGAAAQ